MKEKIAKRLISGEAVNLMGKLHDLSGKPGYYSFASGMPNENTFPVSEMSEAICDVLDNQWEEAMQYNSTHDYLPLKEIIVERHRKEGLHVTTEDILITSSSTQALDICAKTLLNAGDYMLVERPTFMGALNTFKIYNSQLIDVDVSADGVSISSLKKALEKRPKMAYFIPTFQNPAGWCISEENRRAIAEAFKDSDTIILEDNPYGELRFSGEIVPPLKTFIGDKCVLLGSFSKIVSPGMRLGWICCTDKELMKDFYTVKQQCDLHAEGISMRGMTSYFLNNDVDAHIQKSADFYKKNANAIVDALGRYFPAEVKYTTPDGGLFTWVDLPDYIDVGELFDRASEERVLFFPGSTFFIKPEDGRSSLRLSYSCIDVESIYAGIEKLGNIIREMVRENKEATK